MLRLITTNRKIHRILLATQTSRLMSSQMHTFVVWAPDYPNALDRRLAVRQQHLDRASTESSLRMGGAMLTPESLTGGSKEMSGSMLLFEASTIEEVRAKVENDIYWKSDVWDKDKLVILPYVMAAGSMVTK